MGVGYQTSEIYVGCTTTEDLHRDRDEKEGSRLNGQSVDYESNRTFDLRIRSNGV